MWCVRERRPSAIVLEALHPIPRANVRLGAIRKTATVDGQASVAHCSRHDCGLGEQLRRIRFHLEVRASSWSRRRGGVCLYDAVVTSTGRGGVVASSLQATDSRIRNGLHKVRRLCRRHRQWREVPTLRNVTCFGRPRGNLGALATAMLGFRDGAALSASTLHQPNLCQSTAPHTVAEITIAISTAALPISFARLASGWGSIEM